MSIFQVMQQNEMYFHHSMTYPDGTRIQGKLDHGIDVPLYEFNENQLVGKNVLDIATNDGFWAFWAEQKGAIVTAMDAGTYENYDWGVKGMPESAKNLGQQDKWATFKHHHEAMNSKVHYYEGDVYQLTKDTLSEYDLIINYGLLYHLRNPRYALDQCRKVCRGVMILETQIMPINRFLPMHFECGEDVGLITDTDHNWPTESCVAHWLKESDFTVFVQNENTKRNPTRQRFIGAVSSDWIDHFKANENFLLVDDSYWAEVRSHTKQLLNG